jgi:hypothetical protein
LEKLLVKDISITLNRKKGKFTLSFNGQVYEQNVCEFLQTFSFLVGKDLEEHLMNTDSRYDTVRIPLTGCGRSITLGLTDFITFREMYDRQMFQLRLEDLLLRQRVQLPTFH